MTRYVVEVRKYDDDPPRSSIVFLQEVEHVDLVDLFAAVNAKAIQETPPLPIYDEFPPRPTLRLKPPKPNRGA